MKSIRLPLIHLGALLLTVASAAAQTTLYWDTNYDATGCGNSGSSWQGVNWTTSTEGTIPTQLWTEDSHVVFSAGTDGTGDWAVTLATTVSTPSILFKEAANTRTINGGTINIGGGTINSTANGVGEPGGNNGRDVNINSVLAGTGGLTIAAHGNHIANDGGGGGSEFRLGGNNIFAGGLTITSGLVSFSTNANLGDASNLITLNGGGLLYTSDAPLSLPRNLEVGAQGGTIRLYGGKTLTIEGSIANANGVASTTFRRTDGGTLILKGSGAGFTGTFINAANTTQLAAVDANWANTDFVSEGGANLNPNGTGTAVVNSLNTKADVIIDNGTTLNVDSGAITLGPTNGHWYKTNTGALGKLTSSSGTLTVTNGSDTGNLTTWDHQFQVQLTDSGATSVALVKHNRNSLILTQANTYTDGTTINGGRVEAKNAASFGTGTVTVNAAGQAWLNAGGLHPNSFTLNGTGTTEDAGELGAIRFGNASQVGGTVTIATASRITAYDGSETGTIAGPLVGSAALEKTGAGRIVISGSAADYTGTVTVNAGTLKLDSPLGGSVMVSDSGAMAGEGSVSGALTLGQTLGADLHVDGSTAAALGTKDLTVNGMTTVNITGYPAIAGTPFDVVTYSGTLTMADTVAEHFELAGAATYRGAPAFANTGSAITLTIPAGANLIWRGEDETDPSYWDIGTTANWQNGAVTDKFFAGDHVLFDDTGISGEVAMRSMLSPASITFDNSAGYDYNLTGGEGVGFTGPTGIVKNNTGTVSIQGYGHNYTGPVVINDGILRATGFEMLGNASSVTINTSENGGGQLDINGNNLGSGTRHYNLTIAGTGANGLGAITNNGGGSPNENAGLLNLTLSADASVGGNGGRFDIGRSGGLFGLITGNGYTLTKVGGGSVCMRAPAPDLTYVVEGGTLKFEDSDIATGPHPIAVNAGTLQAYGNRTFANTLNFAAGTTLDNDGGGNQTWTGPLNLTGGAGTTVYLSARNGAITLTGVISGESNVTLINNNVLYLAGSAPHTYTGTTTLSGNGQLVLSMTAGAVAVPGDLYMSANGTRGIVSATIDNQFGPNSVLRYTGSGDTRLELKGTTQTLAGLDNTTATPGYNCIQHSEFGAPPAVDGVSDLIVNVAEGASYTYNGVLRDQGGLVKLTKTGPGTQQLFGGLIDFNGTTVVTAGRLLVNSDDSWTAGVEVAADAYYEVNVTSTTDTFENRHAAFALTGAGTYQKTGVGNLTMGWDGGASVAMAPGGLIHIKEGSLRLEYGGLTTWTNNKGDLTIDPGATLDLWDNNNAGVFVDSLNGGGAVIRSNYGQTGTITVGVDNGDGDFSGAISNASGTTHVVKTGTGTQTLGGANTYTGNTTVNGGTLAVTGSLMFRVTNTASNQINGTGTVTLSGGFSIDTSAVTATTGTWLLVNTATLSETFEPSFAITDAGWSEAANVWTRTDGNSIWTFTEATGELKLSQSNSYASWIDGFFPGETDPAIIGATADPDYDGIANAVEMVLGGNPATGMDTALMPTIELVTDPGGTVPDGNYLLFTFRRTDQSVAAGVTAACEADTDLAGVWTPATTIPNAIIEVDDDYASFVPPAATATDRVRVYVPLGANAKLFGRLNVTVP